MSAAYVAQSELDALVRDTDTSQSLSSLSVDTKQTFDRWYSDQMTSSSDSHRGHQADNIDSDDTDRRQQSTTPTSAPASYRLSNGHARTAGSGGHGGRTWFDPVTEIPRLQQWLRQNSHPTRADMARYAMELNAGPHRQPPQRPLDVNNISYWFKNTRARAVRRQATPPPPPQHDRAQAELIADSAARSAPDCRDAAERHDDERVPELPNSNAVYVISPLLQPPRHASDVPVDVTDDAAVRLPGGGVPRSKKRRRDSYESDENHNERCTSSLSSSSSSSEMVAGRTQAASVGGDDEDTGDDGIATDLSVRRPLSSSSLSVQSADDQRQPVSSGMALRPTLASTSPVASLSLQLHPALASTSPAASLSLPLHVQQALQQQMQLAMRYMQHPLYAAASLPPASPAQRWLPWLSAGAKPEPDDDSSTAGSTTGAMAGGLDLAGTCVGELRRKRSRVFIDPLSEIPRLEQWFTIDSHPSSTAIERLTDELNRSAYRQRFPPLEPKNVQLWFKNHRAKVKRQSLESLAQTSQLQSDVNDDVKCTPPSSASLLPSNHYATASEPVS